VASNSTSAVTPTRTPQSNGSHQLHINSACQPDISCSPYAFASTSIIDPVQLANLLTVGENSSIPSAGDYVWRSEDELPTSSTFDQLEFLNPESRIPAHSQLPQILFKLQTISQALKPCPSSEVQKDEIITIVSSLYDITRSSEII